VSENNTYKTLVKRGGGLSLSPKAKLSAAQVRAIRKLRSKGESQTALAEKFAVSQATIHMLLAGKIYRTVV